MKKMLAGILSAVLCLAMFAGCTPSLDDNSSSGSSAGSGSAAGSKLKGEVKTSGSTSMESVVKALAEAFKEAEPDVSVDVQLGGSSAGVSNVIDGISDLGNASRALKDEEKAEGLTENIIAYDGIAMVVNPSNGVENLTKEQLVKIYTGEVTNWKDVGGADKQIVVVGREAGSGTRDGFEEALGIKEKTKHASEQNETGLVKNLVATNDSAIGYISLGYADDSVKMLQVEGVTPTEETVKDKSYPIQRPFVMVSKGALNTQAQAFLYFILSDAGQKIVVQKGFVSVK